MKAAIVVGHNHEAPGARAVSPLNINEFTYWCQVADQLRDWDGAGLDLRVFRRRPMGSYSREVREVYQRVDSWDADCSVELHFNAAGPSATGIETLSSGTKGSLLFSRGLQREMVNRIGLRDRGVKVRSRWERGGLSLWSGRCPAALIEPFFGTNPSDVQRVFEMGILGIAETIVAGLREVKSIP